MAASTKIATQVQDQQPGKNIFTGVRSPGLLAKWPIIGIIMFVFGSLMFGALTYNLFAQGPLLAWDKALATSLPAIGLKSPTYVKVIMDAGFYIGQGVLIVIGILACFYFIRRRYWQELVMLTSGLAGSQLLFFILSHLIARARPPTQIWIILNIPGFPSGHAVTVVVFYGLLAYLLAPNMPSAFWKVIVVAVSVIIIVFVGFSRIFTGGHYLTDILSGYALGIAWSGMAYTWIEIYYQKRRNLHVNQG